MARLAIYKDCGKNITSIHNRFIDEYMIGANDIQLKVYLCLIRMLGAGQATSVSDLADKFNHTERDIVRALKYWEKQQLLTLDYDASGIPVGIHIRDLDTDYEAQKTTRDTMPQSLSIFMEQSPAPIAAGQPARKNDASRDFEETVEAQDRAAYEKPTYTSGDIREFKNRVDTAQIIFIAESYIGRPLTPSEMKSLLFFTDVLHFSVDLIDHLIAYCVERGKKDFKYMERVAINWAEHDVCTPTQAKRFSKKYDKNVYSIMNALGKNNTPTNKEAEYITRWIGEYGFDMDVILEACDRTVLATDRHRLEYAEGILSNWHQENVRHKSDIRKLDELYQQKKASEKKAFDQKTYDQKTQGQKLYAQKTNDKKTYDKAVKPTGGNQFNQFTQNDYDFDALEKELLSN